MNLYGVISIICLGVILVELFNTYKNGYLIDFWGAVLVQFFAVPVFLLYFFGADIENFGAIGWNLLSAQSRFYLAYEIHLVGFACFMFGGLAVVLTYSPSTSNPVFRAISFSIRSANLVPRPIVIVLLVLPVAVLSLFLLAYAFREADNIFHLRGFALTHPEVRPYFNAIFSLFPVVSAVLVMKAVDKKSSLYAGMAIITVLPLLFFGARAPMLHLLLMFLVCYSVLNRFKSSILRLSIGSCVLIFALFGLEVLRKGWDDYRSGDIIDNFMYGNTFSDLRDLGWIFSKWNGDLLGGKTYLAAFISFIPRSMSEFRSDWGVSAFTNNLIGMSDAHAGLRPGVFGEAFINFGYYGVILVGFLSGYVIRYIDITQKYLARMNVGNYLTLYSATIPFLLVQSIWVTADFWRVWVILGFFLAARVLIACTRARYDVSSSLE